MADRPRDLALLAGVPLFSGLDREVIARLLDGARRVEVSAGELLFERGDPGTEVFVVGSGRLEVLINGSVVRVLSRGEAFGELAVLAGSFRTAAVRARRDSELLAVGRAVLNGLLETEPALSVSLIQQLARWLHNAEVPRSASRAAKVLAFVPLQPELRPSLVRSLADTLAVELERLASTTALTVDDDPASWAGRLDNAEAANDVVLLAADEPTGPWSRFCLRQADCALGLMDPALGGPPGSLPLRCQLVSLGTSGLTTWLEALGTAPHHIIPPGGDAPTDVARLARRVTGRSLGLVLSGGGARALAHLGVIDVLGRAGIQIDRVGGTSMGAFVSGLLAMGLDTAEMFELVRRELVAGRPFTDYVVPRHSLIRAVKATAMLQRVFGDVRMEDNACSMFAISADLVRAEQVVHRRGRIADAVGLSMRLPGFAPPRWVGERLHVDGGVVNNLPVEVMTAWAEGPVVAVDAMRPFYAGPPGADGRDLPGIVDVIGRSIVLGSWQRAEHERALAATVISPSAGDVGMFDFTRFAEIVETGRAAAQEALAGNAENWWFTGPPSPPLPV